MKNLIRTSLVIVGILAGSLSNAQEAAESDETVAADGATTAVSTNEGEIANNTAFGDWVVQCEAVTVSSTVCRLVQELTRTDDNTLVVRFIALPSGTDEAILLAQVPIGAYLPGGAVYRLDNLDEATSEGDPSEQREMIWQRCLGDLCEAAIAVSPAEMAEFTAETGILFGYRPDVEADPLIVRADVARFAEAIDAIRTSRPN